MTGAVASKKVTEALKGWLSMDGMRREKLGGYLRRPYRKPTQVGRKRILRPTGEVLLRNSAS